MNSWYIQTETRYISYDFVSLYCFEYDALYFKLLISLIFFFLSLDRTTMLDT